MKTDGDPITATVEQFSTLSGLGRTSIYELINSGALRSVRIMGRRLIVVESYRELVERETVASAIRGSGVPSGTGERKTTGEAQKS